MTDQLRSVQQCFVAEVVGTFLLVFFGCGAVHSAILTGSLSGLWQVGAVWGIAIMVAIYAVGAVSGAHINPAITIGLAAWRLFPANRVAPYILGQVIGAFLAAGTLFVVYHGFLAAKEEAKGVIRGQPGSEITAMVYCEYFPSPGPLAEGDTPYRAEEHIKLNTRIGQPAACLIEIIGTAILAFVVVAVTEGRNPIGPRNMAPVFIGVTVASLICVIAPLTQACFNPARDFGPRLFACFAGWGRIALPGSQGMGFLTVYILSPVFGSIIGVGLYQLVIRPMILPLLEPEEAR
jgi:glycerol uptake facilitator protein